MELVQDAKTVEAPVTVRCTSCGGLRSISYRFRASEADCRECRKGKVVKLSQYHNFWLKRFSMEEIQELGRSIWG